MSNPFQLETNVNVSRFCLSFLLRQASNGLANKSVLFFVLKSFFKFALDFELQPKQQLSSLQKLLF